jgi:hypothetical protein
MNSTNRGFNRALILVVGLVLLAAGLVAIGLGALPAFAKRWTAQGKAVPSTAPAWIADPAVGTVSALTLAIGAVAVVLAVLLVVFIARQGRGHTIRIAERRSGDTGATVVEVGVPRALLDAELSSRPEFISTRVAAYRVRGTETLKVSVQCRRGVAPTDASAIVIHALEGMDQILGTSIPALIQISGGLRVRTATRARLS